MDALWANGTWALCDLPSGKVVTPTQMLCERKRGATGEVTKHKGRFVVQGNHQLYLQDFKETWAPVAHHSTLRMLLAFCAAGSFFVGPLDIATAFFNEDIEEEIYIKQPPGYERGDRRKVCRLLKALYGLKQASRAWYKKLGELLHVLGFAPTGSDPCLFVGTIQGVLCFVLVYVDDLLVASRLEAVMVRVKGAILKAFAGRDLGVPSFFLGMHVRIDRANGTVHLGQQQYIVNLLERFGMSNANGVRLPMAAGAHLKTAGVLLDDKGRQVYQELVGAVQYLATCNRPDISLVAGRLGRYAAAPTVAHLSAGKTLLRYVKGTAQLELRYRKDAPLVGYADADYAGDVDNRRSTTGLLFLRNGGAVSWRSKLQASVAASTTEAEYVASAIAAREAVWLRRLDRKLGGDGGPVTMFGNNQRSLAMMHNAISSVRTKPIDVCHHFVRATRSPREYWRCCTCRRRRWRRTR